MLTTYSRNINLPAKSSRRISWEEFQNRYLQREDNFKYEWVNGQVEKIPRAMDRTQFFILKNLIRFLYKLKAKNPKILGDLVAEGDTFFAGNHRRPDIAYYTDEQFELTKEDKDTIPEFVIEIISKKDQMDKVYAKMKDYRAAEVKVIWHIFPRLGEVHVYHGKNMKVCLGNDICSAEEVIEGFSLTVKEIFS
jgi:Uma2 family endonuclease